MKKILLKAQNVCKTYMQNQILNNINLDIYESDFTIIMGASGAGKSTLLYALSGMDKITSGKIEYKEQEISTFSEKQMAKLRAKEFGFVFQQINLVSNLNLFENIVVAGYINKTKSTKEIQQRATQLLKQMHIENVKTHLPFQTSGGEAQRAAIARAIINNPSIIFADEPTGSLNKSNTEEVLNILSTLNKNNQSILMVTHDLHVAIHGTRILYLEDGKILDELTMPIYEETKAKERETKINTWLSSMQW